jgi:hypothetical protein
MNWTFNGTPYCYAQCVLNFWWVIVQKKKLFVCLYGCWTTHYSMKRLLHNRSDDWAHGDSRFRMRGVCLLPITKQVTNVMPGTSEFCVFLLHVVDTLKQDTRWRSWLRHRATSRKVAGLIPDGVIGIFHWYNPSGRTMALGFTQPLTEVSTRNISWATGA